MRNVDYYSILGIDKAATDDEIKKAYRNLAKTCHPDIDKSAGAEEKFKLINEAYNTLGDNSKRKIYDNQQQFDIGSLFSDFSNFNPFWNDFSFENFFRPPSRQKYVIHKEVKLSLYEAMFGCKKKFEFTYSVSNDSTKRNKTIEVEFNPGTNDGNFNFESNENNHVLIIALQIKIRRDKNFSRNGQLLTAITELSCEDAIFGCKKELERLNGEKFTIDIMPGTQNGQKLTKELDNEKKFTTQYIASVKIPTPDSEEFKSLAARLAVVKPL